MDPLASFCIGVILYEEGGYVNDPQDPGGETNMGISKRAYPNLDIRNLTPAQATAIYYNDYWVKAQCGDIPGSLALYVLNAAVMSGVKEATQLLQNLVGATADGVFGPLTFKAVQKFPLSRHQEYLTLYLQHLQTLGNWPHVGKGWTNRLFNIAKFGGSSVLSLAQSLPNQTS